MLADVQKAPAGGIAGQGALQNMLGSLDTFLAEQKRAHAAGAGAAGAGRRPPGRAGSRSR